MTRGHSDPIRRLALTFFFAGCGAISFLSVRLPAGVALSDVAFACSAVLAAINASVSGRRPPTDRRWNVAAALVAAGGVLASFGAVQPAGSLGVVLRVLFILLVWRWLTLHLLTTEALIHRAVVWFAAGGAISSLVAIGQVLGLTGSTLYGRATGLAAHPNDAGGSLAVALALTMASLVHRPADPRPRQLIAVLLGIGLILSGSVTGMLAALVAAFLVLARRRLRMRFLLKVAMGLSLVYLLGVTTQTKIVSEGIGSVSPIERLTQSTGGGTLEQNTLRTRLESDRLGFDGILRKPVQGHGLDVESGITENGFAVHNGPLLAWYQGGALFFIGVSLAVYGALKGAWARSTGLREVLFVGALTAITYSLTAPVIYNRYFWLPLVLLVAWKRCGQSSERELHVTVGRH